MGNSATKEERTSRAASTDHSYQGHASGSSASAHGLSTGGFPGGNGEASFDGRRVRQDFFASMGMADEGERLPQGTEWRKETKAEREARKLEKERIARAKERERSMREEHVDGGYLVTQGTYTGTEDFNKGIVRQLMVERRVAPFWRGLNDHDDSWTENQLVAAARGLPIPAADEIPPEEGEVTGGLESPQVPPSTSTQSQPLPTATDIPSASLTPRPQIGIPDTSNYLSPSPSSYPSAASAPSSFGSALSKGRSKTFATLTGSSRNQTGEFRPRELRLPRDPHVNGQRLEAHLYKDVGECPICFIYYPPYLNKTRCCDQEMCSECFVQIKRPDPHPPEHQDPSAPPPPPEEAEARAADFVSEPATCPFCKVPQFGITYQPPPFRRGLAYASNPAATPTHQNVSGMSSTSSLVSSEDNSRILPLPQTNRRRTISVSATSPNVITTDQIRPDWAEKLAAARANAARRSAAATALHTAAYMMGNRGQDDARSFAGFGRRGLLRRTSGGETSLHGQPTSAQLFALMSERSALAASHNDYNHSEGAGLLGGPRRGRMDDLEDLMMMEAIRLSLATEEERRKREDKDAKKEAKKKGKETKKAEKEAAKAAKRNGPYAGSANASMMALQESNHGSKKGKNTATSSDQDLGAISSSLPSPSSHPQIHLDRARAQIQNESSPAPSPGFYNSAPYRPSHLRSQSNVSSSASSIDGASPPGSLLQDPREPGSSLDVSPAGSRINIPGASHSQEPFVSGTPPGGAAGTDSMFNFRSLAAMVGDDERMRSLDSEDRENHASSLEPGSSAQETREGRPVQFSADRGSAGKGATQHETPLKHDVAST